MQECEIVANLPLLNEKFALSEVSELILRKRAGAEKMKLDARDLDEYGAQLDRLEAELHVAHEKSALPDEATNRAELNQLVIRARLATL